MINNSHGKRMVQEDLIALLKSFKENGIKSLAVDEQGNFLVNGEPVGGAEYTAGDGISITEGVIANTAKGKQLYQHNIVLIREGLEITLEFISAKATYTKEEFYQYIIDNYDNTNKLLSCKGIYKNPNATSGYLEIIGLYKTSSITQDYIGLSCYDFNFNFDDKIVSATQSNLTNFRYSDMTFNDDVITL